MKRPTALDPAIEWLHTYVYEQDDEGDWHRDYSRPMTQIVCRWFEAEKEWGQDVMTSGHIDCDDPFFVHAEELLRFKAKERYDGRLQPEGQA